MVCRTVPLAVSCTAAGSCATFINATVCAAAFPATPSLHLFYRDVNYPANALFRAAGEKETRAWTIRSGMTAPQAAAVIHSDFEKNFIRAETVAYDDFVKHNGLTGAKEAGAMRLEGKSYVVNEGDVMLFLTSA